MQAPIEVFEAVIDEASDNPASLRLLSLTCSAFLPRVRYHLFSRITIQSVQQMEASSQFLESYPWLLPLVRNVTLSVSVPEDNTQRNLRLLDIVPVHVLSRLPNLRSWTMEITPYEITASIIQPSLWLHRSALWRYRKYGGCIQSLEVTNIFMEDLSSFTTLLSAFTGIRTLSYSCVKFRWKDLSSLDGSESATNALRRPLAISNLIAGPLLNTTATEYLLASSASTLNHLDITVTFQFDCIDYFRERLAALMSRLYLSSLILGIPVYGTGLHIPWGYTDNSPAIAYDLRFFTRVLKGLKRDRLEHVRVTLKLEPVAALGCYLSFDNPLSEACKALEEELLTFPSCDINVCDAKAFRRLGRTEFWSRAINGAFPKLNEQGLFNFTRTQTNIPDPVGHEGIVTCLVASRDSKRMITASEDGTIILWDTEHGTPVHEWLAAVHLGPVRALSLSQDDQRLLCAGSTCGKGDLLVVWEIGDGNDGVRKVAALEHDGTTDCVCCTWSSDDTLIASVSSDGTVRVWDAQTFQRRDGQTNCPSHEHEVLEKFEFCPNSRYLAWTSLTFATCYVSQPFAEGSSAIYFQHPHPNRQGYVAVTAFSFDPDSRRIATAHGAWDSDPPEAHAIRIWDVATGTPLLVFGTPAYAQVICGISFAPDGRSVFSASIGGFVKIWDAESGEHKSSLEALVPRSDRATFDEAVFSPDGKYIAIASTDHRSPSDYHNTVRLWRVIDASCIAEFPEHRGPWISHVAFSPNGEFLASADANGMVHIRRLSKFIG